MNEEDKILKLLEQIKNGDERAFAEFYSQTYKYVYSRAKCMFSDEEEVQDLVQEVYLALYRNAANIQSSESIFGWLKTTTFYQGTKMLKKKRKEVLLSEDGEEMFESIPDDEPEIEEGYMNQEDVQVIRDCINRLSDEQKTVLLAYYYDNLKVNEIAEILSLSAGTIKSRLYLARKNLQVHIEEEEKKRGYKLHSFGAVTLALALRMFLQGNMEVAGSVEETIFARVCQGLNFEVSKAAAAQSGLAEQVVQEGTKQAGKGILGKLGALGAKKVAISAVGIIAAVAIGGVTIGGLNKDEKQPQESIQMEEKQKENNQVEKEENREIQAWQEDYAKFLLGILYLPETITNYGLPEDVELLVNQGVAGKLRFGLYHEKGSETPTLIVALEDLSERFIFIPNRNTKDQYQGKATTDMQAEFHEITLKNVEKECGLTISKRTLSFYQNLGEVYDEYMENCRQSADATRGYFKCVKMYFNQDDVMDLQINDSYNGYQMLLSEGEQYVRIKLNLDSQDEYEHSYRYVEKESILVKIYMGKFEVFEMDENYVLQSRFTVSGNPAAGIKYQDAQGIYEISETQYEEEYKKYPSGIPIIGENDGWLIYEFFDNNGRDIKITD